MATISQQEMLLKSDFEAEKSGVNQHYISQGVSEALAQQIAEEIMVEDPLRATIRQKYGIEVGEYTNPWHAAISSFISFTIGSLLPFIAVVLFPAHFRILGTVLAVSLALILTGYVSAQLGKAPKLAAIRRNLAVGLLTMIVTYGIGALLHVG